ncbi:hypothetical protein H4Q26_013698 [Puccinia striiformis f. sp. tritici PST-130]|nr:hypothetical protein H4Q26_013698 [Puccinia striiformis f. sp. tritici PST-130]
MQIQSSLKTMSANFDPSTMSQDLNMNSDAQGDFIATDFPSGCDYQYLALKADHTSRPLYISPNMATRTIILEAFHPLASQAQDFLITIAEPVSRPSHIHEYKPQNTPYKLLSHYHVESSDPEVLRRLLRDSTISQARLAPEEGTAANTAKEGAMVTFGFNQDLAPKKGDLIIPGTKPGNTANTEGGTSSTSEKPKNADDDLFGAIIGVDNVDENDDDDAVHSFEVQGAEIENVKRRCAELDYPMLEEYDFRNDTVNPTLEIDLKPATQIRPYQEKSLSKMFGNGRARSGIIVLPCGAGKTLVGITAASTIRKSTDNLSIHSRSKGEVAGASGIVVSTYSMVANRTKRSHDSQKMMDFLTSREWGLIILDEVHVVPAAMFRRVVGTIKAHAKLGLTATLVREDDKIDDLNFLIGPKLYEANWMDLAAKDILLTRMPKITKTLYSWGTPQVERMRILQNFQHNPLVNTIFLSKVGDTSIDLPEATCLIQISSHFGSRRQEAQRLGRILRAKRRNDEGFNAFFYSLVSRDTQEFYFSTKRQQFLIDQGYAFKVISHLQGLENLPDLVYASKEEQIELLQSVLLANESDAEIGTDVKNFGDDIRGPNDRQANKKGANSGVRRIVGNLSALSGGQSMSYIERNKSANKQLAKEQAKSRSRIFSKRDEVAKKKRKEKEQQASGS